MNQKFLELLDGVVVGCVATVTADGKPWSTPLHMAFDEDNVYWLSDADTTHSQNIAARPDVSITIWSPDKSRGLRGIYIQSIARELVGDEAGEAREIYRQAFGEIAPNLASANIYQAPIGAKDTTRSRGEILYFSVDKTL